MAGHHTSPKSVLDMLHGIDAKSIEALVDPELVDVRHLRLHIAVLGAEIIEAFETAPLQLRRVIEILDEAIRVKQIA